MRAIELSDLAEACTLLGRVRNMNWYVSELPHSRVRGLRRALAELRQVGAAEALGLLREEGERDVRRDGRLLEPERSVQYRVDDTSKRS